MVPNSNPSWRRLFFTLALLAQHKCRAQDVVDAVEGQSCPTNLNTTDPFGLDESWCKDDQEGCAQWASEGQCLKNPSFMQATCRKSCKVMCGDSQEEALRFIGHYQVSDEFSRQEVDRVNNETVLYMRNTVMVDPSYAEVRFGCKNNWRHCAEWKLQEYCETNPEWMRENCAPACQSCEDLETIIRAPMDLNELTSVDYWTELAEEAGVSLHVGAPKQSDETIETVSADSDYANSFREKMRHDGFAPLDNWTKHANSTKHLQDSISKFVHLLEKLVDNRQLPTHFLFVYDEVWDVIDAVSNLVGPILGSTLCSDFYVFNVRPGGPGWNLHRDRGHTDWHVQFQDEEPFEDLFTYHTIWLALTDSTQDTSSMFFLPAHADRNFRPDDEEYADSSETDREIVIDGHRDIRLVPRETGTAVVFSGRTIHWTSSSPATAPHPRQTLALAVSKADVEPPIVEVPTGGRPPFEARIALCAYVGVSYHFNFHSPLNRDVLVKFLLILGDPKYADHITDEGLSASHGRMMGTYYLINLKRIWEDESLRVTMEEPIKAIAKYIVETRGLEGDEFVRWVYEGAVEDEVEEEED